MATITINDGDINNILVDGNSAGDIFNAAIHNPDAVSDIKAAVASLISGLSQQSASAGEVQALTQQLIEMTADRDANAKDNAALRTGFSSYMSNSAAGQLALIDFNIMLAQNQIAASQELVAQLQAKRAQMAGA